MEKDKRRNIYSSLLDITPEVMNESQLARFLRISPGTLQNWRRVHKLLRPYKATSKNQYFYNAKEIIRAFVVSIIVEKRDDISIIRSNIIGVNYIQDKISELATEYVSYLEDYKKSQEE